MMDLLGQVEEQFKPTARRLMGSGAGIQTAALAFGGFAPPNTDATEEYNGATWTGRWKYWFKYSKI
jgi:hypothetical protein